MSYLVNVTFDNDTTMNIECTSLLTLTTVLSELLAADEQFSSINISTKQ